jgi:choline dehydrogenase-like flavoprotein
MIRRIDKATLYKYFPQTLADSLVNEYYRKAENFMTNNKHTPNPSSKNEDEDHLLNTLKKINPTFKWSLIASESNTHQCYRVARGAYSVVDKLMEIAYNPEDNPNLTILLNTKIDRLENSDGHITGAVTYEGFTLKANTYVLCAGVIESAAIGLRSKLEPKEYIGKCITEHECYEVGIIAKTHSKDINMKLYAKGKFEDKEPYLLYIYINIQKNEINNYPNFSFGYCTNTELIDTNYVILDEESNNPKVKIQRSLINNNKIDHINKQNSQIIQRISETSNIEFISKDYSIKSSIPLGAYCHEVGTLRIGKVVDENLRSYRQKNLYICDLSVFPVSPPANPSLTLAALALRLGETLASSK